MVPGCSGSRKVVGSYGHVGKFLGFAPAVILPLGLPHPRCAGWGSRVLRDGPGRRGGGPRPLPCPGGSRVLRDGPWGGGGGRDPEYPLWDFHVLRDGPGGGKGGGAGRRLRELGGGGGPETCRSAPPEGMRRVRRGGPLALHGPRYQRRDSTSSSPHVGAPFHAEVHNGLC